VVELDDRKLLSILDVEQIIANAFGEPTVANLPQVKADDDVCVFFIDDSIVARRLIGEVLDKLGVRHKYATNGAEAWTRLQAIAAQSQQRGRPLSEEIKVILTDAEMPEMDGYALTRNIRSDPRFDGVPVVMHSSLSSETNSAKGRTAGVDRYVAKFDSVELAEALRPILEK